MRLAIVLVMLAACWSTRSKPADPPQNTAGRPVSAPEVTLAVGRMSFVMDSPDGQRDQAQQAVRSSELAAQLTALGYHVQVVFDETAGDDVIAKANNGAELGRVELFELSHGRGGEPIIEAARRQLGPR